MGFAKIALLSIARFTIIVFIMSILPAAAGVKQRSWRTAKTFVAGTPPSKRYLPLQCLSLQSPPKFRHSVQK